MRVAVLGGGITGLSTAYYLLKYAPKSLVSKVMLVEASDRIGGWINTKKFDDNVIFELGPKSIRPMGEAGFNTLLLAEELGLEADIINISRTDSAAKNRYIWYNNKLHAVPGTIGSLLFKSSLLSKLPIAYVWNDLKTPKLDIGDGDDMTVHDFMSKRFGEDVAMFLVNPLCRGITAGDSKKLSIKSLFPPIFRAERAAGSVIKGMFTVKPELSSVRLQSNKSHLVQRARQNRWTSWSLKQGLSKLPETLFNYLSADELRFENRIGYQCDHIMFKPDGKAVIHISNSKSIKPIEVDHIISTISSPDLAKCISTNKYPELSKRLKQLRQVSVAVVCLEYQGTLIPEDKGFGLLTPSFGDQPVLGIVFDSCGFPQHNAGKNITRLTAMLGGEWFEEIFGDPSAVSSDFILEKALRSVHTCLDITQKPLRHTVVVHKNCIPQYYVGHDSNVKQIVEEIENHNLNLSITGFSYYGVSVNDNILNAKKTVESFLKI